MVLTMIGQCIIDTWPLSAAQWRRVSPSLSTRRTSSTCSESWASTCIEFKSFTKARSDQLTWSCRLSKTTLSCSRLPSFTRSQRVIWKALVLNKSLPSQVARPPRCFPPPWQGCSHWPSPPWARQPPHLSNWVAAHSPVYGRLLNVMQHCNSLPLYFCFPLWILNILYLFHILSHSLSPAHAL